MKGEINENLADAMANAKMLHRSIEELRDMKKILPGTAKVMLGWCREIFRLIELEWPANLNAKYKNK